MCMIVYLIAKKDESLRYITKVCWTSILIIHTSLFGMNWLCFLYRFIFSKVPSVCTGKCRPLEIVNYKITIEYLSVMHVTFK